MAEKNSRMNEKKQGEEIPSIELLKSNLGKIAYTLDKNYLNRLDEDYYVLPYDEYYNNSMGEQTDNGEVIPINTYESNVRALQIKRLVYDEDDNFSDCLQNAISIFSNSGNTIALIVNRFVNRSDIYAVVKNDGQGRNEESKTNIELFKDSLSGNFMGSEFNVIDARNNQTKKIFHKDDSVSLEDKIKSIAVTCGIPSGKSEEYLSQNLEKLINGIVPKKDDEWYSVIIFAESLTNETIHLIREGYEELSSSIYPFNQHQFQVGESKAETQGEMSSMSHSESTSVAISKTHSVNVGANKSMSVGLSAGLSMIASVSGSLNVSKGASLGYGYSWGKTTTSGESDTETFGTNNSVTLGLSDSTTYTYQSFTIKNMLERLEQAMKRVNMGEAIGFWKCSTVICAESSRVSKNVANFVRALTQGVQSNVEPAVIKEWHYEKTNGSTDFDEIKKYILNFSHPVFVNKKDDTVVNYAVNVNTYELSNILSLPRHSVPGLPVTTGVSFGREPHSIGKLTLDLPIGCAYHMYQENDKQTIKISKNELTKHTFITGSTGSGKSTTIYRLLNNLADENIGFLVIEPAKGEYRKVLGNRDDVVTYGTNIKMENTELLRINPFKFSKGTHILEHLDRLVEIFNVCWPMYAAMPAILKDAVERAYIKAGWDLISSTNRYDDNLFPTFNDVVSQIKEVLQESDYSDDNKGDYTGSLVTRLKSLTTGIYGLVFSADDISDEKLFDRKVVVDLSRVGSTETKALIMGFLVLKLQEYRMEKGETNSDLNHVTVLEEAHNLLKRTSTEQSNESANLIGKSVELLANSIAEMRTYGEGFIIADQSPGLLDMSVIRNTNTKIIMRLPDASDRELVGRAAGLNDKQVRELSRLAQGVAAIHQSEWLEPVLCKIEKYVPETDSNVKKSNDDTAKIQYDNTETVQESLLECIMNNEIYRKGDRLDLQKIQSAVLKSNMEAAVKCDFLDYINAEKDMAIDALRSLVYDFFKAEKAIEKAKKSNDIVEWVHVVADNLSPTVNSYSKKQIDLVMALLIYEQSIRDFSYNNLLCRFTELMADKGGVY